MARKLIIIIRISYLALYEANSLEFNNSLVCGTGFLVLVGFLDLNEYLLLLFLNGTEHTKYNMREVSKSDTIQRRLKKRNHHDELKQHYL